MEDVVLFKWVTEDQSWMIVPEGKIVMHSRVESFIVITLSVPSVAKAVGIINPSRNNHLPYLVVPDSYTTNNRALFLFVLSVPPLKRSVGRTGRFCGLQKVVEGERDQLSSFFCNKQTYITKEGTWFSDDKKNQTNNERYVGRSLCTFLSVNKQSIATSTSSFLLSTISCRPSFRSRSRSVIFLSTRLFFFVREGCKKKVEQEKGGRESERGIFTRVWSGRKIHTLPLVIGCTPLLVDSLLSYWYGILVSIFFSFFPQFLFTGRKRGRRWEKK